MEFREDSIYYSDEDSSDELYFWSESDDEDDDSRPVCVGCQCKEKTCENLMPLVGSVMWNNSLWDAQDYIELNSRLQTIGVKLFYNCLKCQTCEDCTLPRTVFPKSLKYEEKRQVIYVHSSIFPFAPTINYGNC